MQSRSPTLPNSARIGRQWLTAGVRHRILPYVIIVWSALAVYCYRHVIGDLFHQWRINASFSHGPLVIPIAIWLLWHRRSSLPETKKPWPAALGLLVAAHTLLWLGNYYHVPALERWTIPLWLSGVVGLLWGRHVLAWSLPGICFLGFMIPIPFQLEILVSQALQWSSAWCSCYLLGLTSTVAVTDGYTLRMATGQVGITADCSGLRMTVAMAALGYVIVFVNCRRRRAGRSYNLPDAVRRSHNRPTEFCGEEDCSDEAISARSAGLASRSRIAQLCWTALLLVPAAVLANAMRIALMALAVDRYQLNSVTTSVHNLGEWAVLPVSLCLFWIFRTWADRALRAWRAVVAARRLDCEEFDVSRSRHARATLLVRAACAPIAILILSAAVIWHYDHQREQAIVAMTNAAHNHEVKAEWRQAATCYQELLYLDPSSDEMRFRHAWVTLQGARNIEERKRVFFQLESLVQRAPAQQDALRTHLELALELGAARSALRSAKHLYFADRHNSRTVQMVVEALLRFSPDSPDLSSLSVDSLNQLADTMGPPSQWSDDLVIEMAEFCCCHPDCKNTQLVSAVGRVITPTAVKLDSARAYYVSWQFEHLFGQDTGSLQLARKRINGNCPQQVAYEIYIASADQARRVARPEDARRWLQKAVGLRPRDPRGHVLMGDVHAAQGNWAPSAAAYSCAWRLSDERSWELGIKLAESLLLSEDYCSAAELVDLLAEKTGGTLSRPDRLLRIRLQLVRAQLDMQAGQLDEALQKLDRCQLLATLSRSRQGVPNELLQKIETLQVQSLMRLGRYADAARLFEDRAARSDAPETEWTAAARSWRSAGNASAAARCYRNALYESGEFSLVWLEYIQLLKATRGMDEALAEVALRHGVGRKDAPIADEISAQAWEMVGNPLRAIQHYRSAAQRKTSNFAALAIALARHGKADEAVALISDQRWSVDSCVRARTAAIAGLTAADLSDTAQATIMQLIEDGVAAAGDDVSLLLAAAEWYTRCQATSRALEMLRRAVALDPKHLVAANNLAMLLASENRDCDQALQTIEDILQRTGPVAQFLDTKGWILVQMNRAEEAIACLAEADRRTASSDPIAKLHLATAYLAVGDRRRALEYLQAAQASQIRLESLNSSERRAWVALRQEFPPHDVTHGENGA